MITTRRTGWSGAHPRRALAPDGSGHLEIACDPVVLADMLNALDPARPVRVPCLTALPVFGPVGPVPPF